nr:MAG TPA: hypothetical protein [Bacteriophage sp.]
MWMLSFIHSFLKNSSSGLTRKILPIFSVLF